MKPSPSQLSHYKPNDLGQEQLIPSTSVFLPENGNGNTSVCGAVISMKWEKVHEVRSISPATQKELNEGES